MGEVSFMNSMLKGGVRPAFNLDKTQILYTNVVGSLNNTNGEWSKIGKTNSSEYKITLKDQKRKFFDIPNTSPINIKSNDKISLDYKSAAYGENEYISVIIQDAKGNNIYYGNVANVTNNNGNATFSLPVDLSEGKYTLKVFNEQVNGDRQTNYASDFINIELNVTEKVVKPTVVRYSKENNTIIQHLSDGNIAKSSICLDKTTVEYTGNAIKDIAKLNIDSNWIGKKPDIKYTNNTNVGKATAYIEIDNYKVELNFEIVKAKQNEPKELKIISTSENSITLNKISNAEYRIQNGKWKDSNVFNNLESDKEYVFEVRYKETDTHNASKTVSIKGKTLKHKSPTIKVEYSTKEPTNKDVTATLVCGDKITITNNNGKNTYTFKENGNFTFEYVDKYGNKGTAKAEVNWIDKIVPTAKIEYSTQKETYEPVIAKLVSNERIKIINNEGKEEYTFNKNGSFEFIYEDEAGNVGRTTAKVDWIKEKEEIKNEIVSNEYLIKDNEIKNVEEQTNVKEFKKNLQSNQAIKLVTAKGEELKENDVVGTGTIVKVGDSKEYVIIVTGDVDGDGKNTLNDLAKLKLDYLELEKLKESYLKAGDLDNDNLVTINGIAKFKISFMNIKREK